MSGIRGLVQNLRQHIGGDVTLADLAGHRATLLQGPRFVGTGPEVADQMEEWFEGDACDGFVIAATHSPGAYEDVVRLVVPELQRRGRVPRPLHRRRRCATTSASPGPRSAPVPDAGRGPLARAAGRRGGHARRRADGRHRPRRVRRRGHQGRAARRRRPDAHLGQPPRRHRPGVEERQPQQALRHARPPPARGPGAVPPSCSTSATCSSSATGPAPSSAGASTTRPCTPATRTS